ncbi:MAG: HAMP domain-containing sensor histidine kinase [Gemmatimonadaceae bacterium]
MMLRTRLAIGIGGIMAFMIVPVALSVVSLNELRDDTVRIRDTEFQAAVVLGKIRATAQELDQAKIYLSILTEASTQEQFAAKLANLRALVDTLSTVNGMVGINRVRFAIRTLDAESNRAHQLAAAGRTALADSIIDRALNPALDEVNRSVSYTEQALQETTREHVSQIAEESVRSRATSLRLLAAAALLAVLIGLWLTHSISRPIDELDAGMRAVAAGDFGHPLQLAPQREDEFGRLAESYNSMATQLRELDRLKAEFISVASHELKTPINVVMGYLQLLQEHVYGELNPRQQEVLTTLTAQSKSLSRLVRQLLDVSRFEAGGGKVEPRAIAFPAFLGDLERTFRVLAIQRNVAFAVTRGGQLPAEVRWDPERINEVLGNLLSNAFKFTPGGGSVELDVTREGENVRMRVRDSGAGIPATELPYVFEKFYQANNQTTGIKGTGLGLAIAKGIVTAHGGTIGVESTVGVGTSFNLLLPTRSAATRLAPFHPQEAPAA